MTSVVHCDEPAPKLPNIRHAEVDKHLLKAWVAMLNASRDRSSIPAPYDEIAEAMNRHFEARYGGDPYNGCLFHASHDETHDSSAHLSAYDLFRRWEDYLKEESER